jgi:hypothetical protein
MEDNLWNNFTSSSVYKTNSVLYQNHILEQYKIYVEMADRISARRNLSNGFFLTLNTLSLTAIGFLFEKVSIINPKWIIFFPLAGVILICIIWWWLLKSYRDLNSAKYKVIGQLEKKLPSSPYWSAEWKELGEGSDIKKYLPLTALEKIVPIVFGVVYLMISIYIIWMM